VEDAAVAKENPPPVENPYYDPEQFCIPAQIFRVP